MLTPRDHEHFIRHGYVILRDVVPRETCERAVRILEAGASDQTALDACCTQPILDAVGELHGDAGFAKRGGASDRPRPHTPEAQWVVGAHCDLIYTQVLPDSWSVGSFIFLTKSHARGAAFMVAPGSPRRYKRLATDRSAEGLWGEQWFQRHSGPLIEVLAEPGDAILFSHFMGHSATVNLVDPATRHALDVRFITSEPLAPYRKSFEAMSTLEKANSAAYLRDVLGDPFELPTPAAPEPFGTGVLTHDIVRLDGWNHLFVWDGASLSRSRSRGLSGWTEPEPVAIDAPIEILHIEPRWGFTITTGTRAFISTDLETWTPAADPGGLVGRVHFVHETQGSVAASGRCFLYTTGDWWASGDSRELPAGDGGSRGSALAHPAELTDAAIYAIVDGWDFVFVGEAGGRSMWTRSRTSDSYADPLMPFEPEVSGLRVFLRGGRYWVVSFVRDGKVHFGTIDWSAAPGTITELVDAAGVADAYGRTGLA